MSNNSTFLFIKIHKLKEFNSILQYAKCTKYTYSDACFTFMCSFAQSIFLFFFLSRFDCSWLSISSAVGLVLLLDVKVLIFCLINKWIIMGPTHSVLWLNLFNLFTANGECWLWSNSGRHFNSRGLIDQSLLLIENRSQN